MSSGESAENPPQQRGQSGLVEIVRGDGDHRGVELFFDHGRALRRDTIQFQKQQGRADSRPLVLVKKALGLSEVGGLGRSDIELVAVRNVSLISCIPKVHLPSRVILSPLL